MLYKGYIHDSNGFFNQVFKNIIKYEYAENELPTDYLLCKQFLINEFKNNGSYSKNKFTNEVS